MPLFKNFIHSKLTLFSFVLLLAVFGVFLPKEIKAATLGYLLPPYLQVPPNTSTLNAINIQGIGFNATSRVWARALANYFPFGIGSGNWRELPTTWSAGAPSFIRTTLDLPPTTSGRVEFKVITDGVDSVGGNGTYATLTLSITNPGQDSWWTTLVNTLLSPLSFIILVLIGFQKVVSIIFYQLASFAFSLFSTFVQKLIESPQFAITKNDAFLSIWNVMKSYANMLLVLELVAAAIMMILNVWKENAKKIVTWVIITALIINFSTVICGTLIDVSNIIMKDLIGGGRSFDIIETIHRAENVFLRDSGSVFGLTSSIGNIDITKAATFLLVSWIFSIMYISTFCVFVYFLIILIQRYIYLAFLFIVSPLAFALWAFPKTEHFFTDWWRLFWKNCFIGIGAAFAIYLAFTMLKFSTDATVGIGIRDVSLLSPATTNGINTSTGFEMLAKIFFSFTVVLGFLFYGLRMAAKTAGPIGDMVMAALAAVTVAVVEAVATGGASLAATEGGLMTKLGAATTSATKQLGKSITEGGGGLIKKGLSGAAEGVTGSDRFSKRFGESKVLQDKLGYAWNRVTGDTNEKRLADQKRLQEQKQKMALLSDEELAKIANTSTDRLKMAAAAGMLADKKKFYMVDEGKREAVAKNAVDYGVKKSTITDQHPELLTSMIWDVHQSLIEKKKAEYEDFNINQMGMTPEQAKAEAIKMVKSYIPTKEEMTEERQKLQVAKTKERTSGYEPVTNKEAKSKIISDKLDSEKAATERIVRLQNVGATEDHIQAKLKEEMARKKKEYQATYNPSASEMITAREALLKERGTPEAATRNETNRSRIKALHPEMTSDEVTRKIQWEEYKKYNPDFKGKKIEEIAKIAKEQPQTSLGTRAMEYILKEKRRDLLLKSATNTDGFTQDELAKRLQFAQTQFDSNVIQESAKTRPEDAALNTPEVERLMATYTTGTPAQKRAKAEEELVRRAGPRAVNENKDLMPKTASEQIEKIAEALKDSSGNIDPNKKLEGALAGMLEALAKNGGDLKKLATALGGGVAGFEMVGKQLEHVADKFDSDAAKTAAKTDSHYAGFDNEAVERKLQEGGKSIKTATAVEIAAARNTVRLEAHGKVDAGSMRKMSEKVFDLEFAANADAGSISRANSQGDGLSDKQIQALKASLSQIEQRIDRLIDAANKAQQNGNTALSNQLMGQALNLEANYKAIEALK